MARNISYISTSRAVYLRGILTRLENDVDPYVALLYGAIRDRLDNGHKKGPYGYWPLTRMIMPPIYAAAKAVPGLSPKMAEEKEIELVQNLLQSLYVPCPALVIEMFRNSLMHNDHLRGLVYEKYRIGWSLGFGTGRHYVGNGVLHLDLEELYKDFKAYLSAQIAIAEKDKSEVGLPRDLLLDSRSNNRVVTEITLSQTVVDDDKELGIDMLDS